MPTIEAISARSANLLMAKTAVVSIGAGGVIGAGVARLGFGGSDHAREHLTRGVLATTALAVTGGAAGLLAFGHSLTVDPRAESRFVVDGAEQVAHRWFAIPRAHLGWGVMAAGLSAVLVGAGMSMRYTLGTMVS
jgi:hypothetical protein